MFYSVWSCWRATTRTDLSRPRTKAKNAKNEMKSHGRPKIDFLQSLTSCNEVSIGIAAIKSLTIRVVGWWCCCFRRSFVTNWFCLTHMTWWIVIRFFFVSVTYWLALWVKCCTTDVVSKDFIDDLRIICLVLIEMFVMLERIGAER